MTPAQQQILKQRISKFAQEKRYPDAAVLAKQLVEANPRDIEAWWVMSQLLIQLRDYRQAIYSLAKVRQIESPVYDKALEKSVELVTVFGLWDLGELPAKELASRKPDDAEAHFGLGLVCFFLNRYLEAIASFERALEICPTHIDALNRCGMSYGYIGRNDVAREFFARSLRIQGNGNRAQRLRVSSLLYSENTLESEIFEAHKEAANSLYPGLRQVDGLDRSARTVDCPIRIGFCSEDFRRHSVAYFLLPILESAAQSNWEIYCYSDTQIEDEVSETFKSLCSQWRDVRSLDDAELLNTIRADEIDVLFDLMAYFGHSRLNVFASRAAPVQVTYLGYPHTTGLKEMDYRLVDPLTDPSGDKFYTETLYRLPHSFLCYGPSTEAPGVSALPAESSGFVTFASFNSMQKISDMVVDAWASILKQVPNARLIIKSIPLGEDELAERLYKRFVDKGIDKNRVEILGILPSTKQHLELYSRVDIHLDTFPYNGTTTTCEALWQGVPTLTFAGESHRSRVGLSILSQVGLEEWVADSVEDYVSLAVAKVSDIESLKALRSELRGIMRKSPLCNGERMVEDLSGFMGEVLATQRSV